MCLPCRGTPARSASEGSGFRYQPEAPARELRNPRWRFGLVSEKKPSLARRAGVLCWSQRLEVLDDGEALRVGEVIADVVLGELGLLVILAELLRDAVVAAPVRADVVDRDDLVGIFALRPVGAVAAGTRGLEQVRPFLRQGRIDGQRILWRFQRQD